MSFDLANDLVEVFAHRRRERIGFAAKFSERLRDLRMGSNGVRTRFVFGHAPTLCLPPRPESNGDYHGSPWFTLLSGPPGFAFGRHDARGPKTIEIRVEPELPRPGERQIAPSSPCLGISMGFEILGARKETGISEHCVAPNRRLVERRWLRSLRVAVHWSFDNEPEKNQ